MALIYQTEYHLGRARRVTRTYGGVRAFVAISIDLALALIFGVIGLAFGLVGWTLRLAYRLVRLVVLGILELLAALGRFAWDVATLPGRMARRHRGHRAIKPAWASFDEL